MCVYFSTRHIQLNSEFLEEDQRLGLQEPEFRGVCWQACCPLDTVITMSCGRHE
jgi:hypothetical protein